MKVAEGLYKIVYILLKGFYRFFFKNNNAFCRYI